MTNTTNLADTLRFETESHFDYLEKLKSLFESARREAEDETLMEVMLVFSFKYAQHFAERSSLENFVKEGLRRVQETPIEDNESTTFH